MNDLLKAIISVYYVRWRVIDHLVKGGVLTTFSTLWLYYCEVICCMFNQCCKLFNINSQIKFVTHVNCASFEVNHYILHS